MIVSVGLTVIIIAIVAIAISVSLREVYATESLLSKIRRRKKNANDSNSDNVLFSVCRCCFCADKRKN